MKILSYRANVHNCIYNYLLSKSWTCMNQSKYHAVIVSTTSRELKWWKSGQVDLRKSWVHFFSITLSLSGLIWTTWRNKKEKDQRLFWIWNLSNKLIYNERMLHYIIISWLTVSIKYIWRDLFILDLPLDHYNRLPVYEWICFYILLEYRE